MSGDRKLDSFYRINSDSNLVCWRAGFLPRSVSQRHPRVPHERHHVSRLRTVAAVLEELLRSKHRRTGAAGLTPPSSRHRPL